MIEVEKKFILQSDDLALLVAGARFLIEKRFTDIYYDTADHALTKQSIWLRARAGKFELKFPMGINERTKNITSYDEIEDEVLIARKLGLVEDVPLGTTLALRAYRPFATITTTRSQYEKNGFHIDVDSADFGYSVSEVELMVESEIDIASASRRILDFVATQGIPTTEGIVRGKVIEYIRRNDPDHFHALEQAWGIAL